MSAIIFRFAPAKKLSGLPEMKIRPLSPGVLATSPINSSKLRKAASVQVFMASPATSKVTTPMPPSSTFRLNILPIETSLVFDVGA